MSTSKTIRRIGMSVCILAFFLFLDRQPKLIISPDQNTSIASLQEAILTIQTIKKIGPHQGIAGQGKGVLIGKNGILVTNRHVLEDLTASYEAILSDGTRISINNIWHLTGKDLAFASLFTTGNTMDKNLITAQISSHKITKGETISFINTEGKEEKSKILEFTPAKYLIQTQSKILPGQSGSPVCNTKGEIIGLITSTDAFGSGNTRITPITPEDIPDSIAQVSLLKGDTAEPRGIKKTQ